MELFANQKRLMTKSSSRQICLFAVMFLTYHSFSQKQTTVDVTRVTRVAFLNPGFSYEDRVGRLQTVHFDAYLSTSAYYSYSSSLGTNAGIYFDPALMVQYRYYYNAAARESKGRRTERNSMNYIGPMFDVAFSKAAVTEQSLEEENRRPISTVGFIWGIQRNYKKRFSLDLNVGLGYYFTQGTELDYYGQPVKISQSGFTVPTNISLGFWLNKR